MPEQFSNRRHRPEGDPPLHEALQQLAELPVDEILRPWQAVSGAIAERTPEGVKALPVLIDRLGRDDYGDLSVNAVSVLSRALTLATPEIKEWIVDELSQVTNDEEHPRRIACIKSLAQTKVIKCNERISMLVPGLLSDDMMDRFGALTEINHLVHDLFDEKEYRAAKRTMRQVMPLVVDVMKNNQGGEFQLDRNAAMTTIRDWLERDLETTLQVLLEIPREEDANDVEISQREALVLTIMRKGVDGLRDVTPFLIALAVEGNEVNRLALTAIAARGTASIEPVCERVNELEDPNKKLICAGILPLCGAGGLEKVLDYLDRTKDDKQKRRNGFDLLTSYSQYVSRGAHTDVRQQYNAKVEAILRGERVQNMIAEALASDDPRLAFRAEEFQKSLQDL